MPRVEGLGGPYFNSSGPRIDESGYGSVIARLAGQAFHSEPITVHGDGLQTRCFTYVSDTVEGTITAATRSEAVGAVFNIGRARQTTVRELANRIRTMLGDTPHVRWSSSRQTPTPRSCPRRSV